MGESLSFDFERAAATQEAERRREPTMEEVRRFISERRHEPEFAITAKVPHWGPEDALMDLESYGNRLRNESSPDLRRSRELIHFLDEQTHSGGHAKMTSPHEITLLLAPEIGKILTEADRNDSREMLEARTQHDEELAGLRAYEQRGEIEPILANIESRIAYLDYQIEREYRQPNKNSADEKRRREGIKKLEAERQRFRRGRIFLLGQYFGK